MTIRLNVGRQNITRALSPADAGYVVGMRNQMRMLKKNMEAVIEGIEDATPRALRHGLRPIFRTSQRLVPVDTGALKASGFLEVRRTTRGATGAVCYAKGGRPFYASIVHERLDLRHKSPTQAKFLEEAVNRHIGNFARRVREFIRDDTGLT